MISSESESDVSERGPGLPVGVEWHVCKFDGNARIHAKENDWLPEPNRPLAGADGTWIVFSKTRPIRVIAESAVPATPRPGETLLVAARCEVEQALWRLGCFGPVVCAHCGKPAACFGSYEGRPTAYACDACCGHGREDGHCEPVEVDSSAKAAEPACVDGDHHPLDPRPANGYEPASTDAAEWPTPAHVRAVYNAAVAWEATEVGSPAESAAIDKLHETIALGDEVGEPAPADTDVLARPSPDRAAWLLHPVSSTGRETIAASQYEELRAEAVALRDSVATLERKIAGVVEQCRDALERERVTKAQFRVVNAGVEDVWRWAGDGEDHPESLSCPVVMSAETLREFVAARESVAKLEATNERLRKRASEHLDAAGLRALYVALEDDNMHSEAAMVQRLANGVAAHSRWFAIPERQRLDRIGQIVDQLADVRHELDDDDIEAAEALIDLAKGAPSPVARAVAEALSIAPVDVREGPFGTTVDAMNAITDLAMKSGNGDGSPCPERSWLRRIVKVGLLALACDAELATKEPSR